MTTGFFDGVNGKTIIKHPAAIRNYKIRWADWCAANNTSVQSISVGTPVGVTLVTSTVNVSDSSIIVQLSGGTAGGTGSLTVTMTTADGQTDPRTINFQFINR